MQQCATASEDGTCIIWDLERYTRSQMVMANSLFQVLVLHNFIYFYLHKIFISKFSVLYGVMTKIKLLPLALIEKFAIGKRWTDHSLDRYLIE